MQENSDTVRSAERVRERVLVALAVIARPELAIEASGLGQQRVGFELCRLWFEHVYVPGLWTVDGLKGDRRSDAVEAFWNAFDDEERKYLERLNRFMELRLEMTPEELRQKGWIDPDRWSGIVRDARNTLALIAPDFQITRARIAELLQGRLPGEAGS